MQNTVSKDLTGLEHNRVTERPDGFYWVNEESGREYGPFLTLQAAMQDMQDAGVSDFEEGVPLDEAESEIGITDWIDPDTSEPATETTPRFQD